MHVGAGRVGTGINVYVQEGIATRAALMWDRGDDNTLVMGVFTPRGKHHVLAVHSPQSQVGQEVYLQWCADMWRHVAQVVDPISVLLLADMNLAARPEDRSRPRGDEVGYRTFLRAFDLRDLIDLRPVPWGYSWF